MDCSLPGSSVHGISQAKILEYGLPFPSPGDLPHSGIKPTSPKLQVGSLLPSHRGSPWIFSNHIWDLGPWPGMVPGPPALGGWSLSLCTTREVPYFCFRLPPPSNSIIWIEKSLFKTFKQRIFIKALSIMENWKQSKFQTIKDAFNFLLENGKRKAQSRK